MTEAVTSARHAGRKSKKTTADLAPKQYATDLTPKQYEERLKSDARCILHDDILHDIF